MTSSSLGTACVWLVVSVEYTPNDADVRRHGSGVLKRLTGNMLRRIEGAIVETLQGDVDVEDGVRVDVDQRLLPPLSAPMTTPAQ